MHIPVGTISKAVIALFSWLRATLGLGLEKYPQYLRHSDHPFSDELMKELCAFLNAAFLVDYKPYDVTRLKSWLTVAPDLYVVVIDRLLLATTPLKPTVVGTYKLVPLSRSATEQALGGMIEIIDIKASELASSLDEASGIWIGDLSVVSPLRCASSGGLGRHLVESIRQELRRYKGAVPIFCRSERQDIQALLLRLGFHPIQEGEISGKTVWLLPTNFQKSWLRKAA
jgi:hypothetical protein